LCHPRWLACEGPIDATVKRLPAAVSQVAFDGIRVQPRLERLPASDNAVLEVEEFAAGSVTMHDLSLAVKDAAPHGVAKPCG
jgi:hypothetical protein